MKFIKYPIVPLLLFFSIGIVIGFNTSFSIYLPFWSLITSLLLIILSYFFNEKRKKNSSLLGIPIYSSFLFLGWFSQIIHTEINNKLHFSHHLKNEKNLVVGQIIERLKGTLYYEKYVLDVHQINQKKTIGKLLIYIPKERKLSIKLSQNIRIISKIKNIESIYNPYQFNYTDYLNRQNIYQELHLKKEDKIQIQETKNWRYYLNYCKESLIERFHKLGLKEENYNLLIALLFGERTTVSKELTANYTNTGVIHILAISGLHIALIYQIILWSTLPLKRRKNGTITVFILSLSILWIYALIAGLSASVVRSVVMFTVIAYGQLLKREINIYNALATSALLLLVWNPNYILDIGFQLSYCAVLAIVAFQPIVNKYAYSKYKIILKIKETLLMTLVAQLGVLPLTLYYFGQFPLLFLIANLVVIPLSSLILILGLALIPSVYLYFPLAKIIGYITNFCIDWMNTFTRWLSHFDIFVIKNIAFHSSMAISLFFIVVSLLFLLSHPKKKNAYWVLASIFLFQFCYLIQIITKKEDRELIIFNTYKSSLVAIKEKEKIHFLTTDSTKNKTLIANYCRSNFVKKSTIRSLENTIYFKQKILRIDTNGIYKTKIKPDIIYLTTSPKINLERIINQLQPKLIVADGSNFKSYIQLWKKTCSSLNQHFHATTEKGIFILK